MKIIKQLCWISCLLIVSTLHALDPERIVVVANEADADSLAIAEHYIGLRSIPADNLILISCSKGENIDWDAFVETIFNPLRKTLIEREWIKGALSDKVDSEGRVVLASLGHTIDFMVVCRIPLRISNDKERLEKTADQHIQKQFNVNQAAVDSELALLAAMDTPTVAFVKNPLFGVADPPSLTMEQVIRVARLDGPSVEAAMSLVDNAILAEGQGMMGRGYIDLGGPHPKGNEWISEAGMQVESLHYPTSWDRESASFGYKQRFDAPAFYFGWWQHNIEGVVAERDYRFPPGAVGWHLHSFSATTLRQSKRRWSGPLVARGLTATVGNVYEPYLELTHHPHGFMEGLIKGMSAGEAAYYALPSLSWMTIFLGDPLYQPLKVTLDDQLEALDPDDAYSQYIVLRKMEGLKQDEGTEAAFAYGKRLFHQAPGLALAYELAKLAQMDGDAASAKRYLEYAALITRFRPEQWGLAYNMARLLWDLQNRPMAYKILRTLLYSGLPTPAIKELYPTGINWARAMAEFRDLDDWKTTLDDILAKEQAEREARERAK